MIKNLKINNLIIGYIKNYYYYYSRIMVGATNYDSKGFMSCISLKLKDLSTNY